MGVENGQGFVPVADIEEALPVTKNYLPVKILNKASGGGGVETVGGTAVDNSDPLNPIIDYQTSDETPNDSAVTGANVTEALDSLLAEQNILRQKIHFIATSTSTVTVGTDGDNPSFLTGLTLDNGSFGVSLNSADGAITNVTSREIPQLTGTISFQPNKSGGGTTVVHLWSERSSDGVTWTQNSESLRVIEVPNNGETFKTALSALLDWMPNEIARFRMYAVSGGAVNFESPTDTVLGGEVITGASVAWELTET